ncbi:MAG: prepilin-type N-terminal cleavage/methylation domain-containing protein, partial [Planctomycetota bacterium]
MRTRRGFTLIELITV